MLAVLSPMVELSPQLVSQDDHSQMQVPRPREILECRESDDCICSGCFESCQLYNRARNPASAAERRDQITTPDLD